MHVALGLATAELLAADGVRRILLTGSGGPFRTRAVEELHEVTPDEAAGETVYILYEIQPEEALRRVSETFGITRNRIRRENPELEGVASADLPGIVIEIPITGDMTLAEAEALPGYVSLAPVDASEPDAGG